MREEEPAACQHPPQPAQNKLRCCPCCRHGALSLSPAHHNQQCWECCPWRWAAAGMGQAGAAVSFAPLGAAETHLSCCHHHGLGCLDVLPGSFICGGDVLLASAASLTREDWDAWRHGAPFVGEQAEPPPPAIFSCWAFSKETNCRQKSLAKGEKVPFAPKGKGLGPRGAAQGPSPTWEPARVGCSVMHCQGWHGTPRQLQHAQGGDALCKSKQLEPTAVNHSRTPRAMGSLLALPLSLWQRPLWG